MKLPSPPPAAFKPQKRGVKRLAGLVPGLVEPVLRQRGFASISVLAEWAEIVGPHLSRYASPLEIRWPKRRDGEAQPARGIRQQRAEQATLVVACPSAFALDLSMGSAAIIELVNRRLGFACIGRVEIRQMPLPLSQSPASPAMPDPALVASIGAKLSDIADDELRASLARLGASIVQKTKPRR